MKKTIGKIDYSVVMLANGMNENEPKRAYAFLQQKGNISTEQLAKHIISHGSNFSLGTVTGVLTDLGECIAHLLLEGYSITLNDIGIIYPSIRSKGAENAEKFTTDHITALSAKFMARGELANLRENVRFNRVPTRKAQALTLQAQTNGEATVNLVDDDEDDGEGGE